MASFDKVTKAYEGGDTTVNKATFKVVAEPKASTKDTKSKSMISNAEIIQISE